MPSLLIYHPQIRLKSTVVPTLVTILVLILISFLLATLSLDVCLLISITSEMPLTSTLFSAIGNLEDSKILVEEGFVSGKVTAILVSVVIEDILEVPPLEYYLAFFTHPDQTSKHHFRHPFNAILLFWTVYFPLNSRRCKTSFV